MEEIALPKLRVSRKEAKDKIQAQIEKGELLRGRKICSEDELDKSGIEANNWSNYNRDLLIKLFDNLSIKNEYENFHYYRLSYQEVEDRLNVGFPIDWQYRVDEEYQRNIADSINSLQGIYDRLELFDEALDTTAHALNNKGFSDNPTRTFGDHVFIVHGHDAGAKHAIARFVENFDLKSVILDEEASKGQTIIDKFEENAGKAGFAIVLLTPDDVGAPKDQTGDLKPRARQNVILEFGYFLCGLGRERVCVLYKEGVERPSDIQGIVYISLNNPNEWQLKLAKEMKQAGLPIDLNKLVQDG